jgi:hypothetical protein
MVLSLGSRASAARVFDHVRGVIGKVLRHGFGGEEHVRVDLVVVQCPHRHDAP